MMRIAVVGAGGVGGWLGARLAAAGADVHVVARGAHLEAVRARGLTLFSPAGDVVARVSATTAAAYQPALCAEGTAVVPLQNGIDNADRLAAVVGRSQVVGWLALIASRVTERGVVVHSVGPARFVFGELDGSPSTRTSELLAACDVTGVDTRRSDRIREELLDKFAFLCALAGTTASIRLPIGDIRACAASWAMFRRLVEEVYAVARAVGITVAPDAVEQRVAFTEGLEPHVHASLHDDLVAGRRIELDALHGTVVRLGRRYGVPTPMSAAVDAVLRPHAERADAARSPRQV